MRRFLHASSVALLAASVAAPALRAQSAGRIPTPCEESEDSPHGRNAALCSAPRNFSLFGFGDNAVAGLSTASPDITFIVAASTPGDRTVMANQLPIYIRGVRAGPGIWSARFFEYHFYQAAARGDWARARESIPSLGNVRGGGYAFATNSRQYGGPDLFTAHDGALGSLYRGAQSGPSGCLNQSRSFVANGLTLLATSDCEATWPDAGWQGSPYLGQDSWVQYQSRVGRGNFTFDFWKVPKSLGDPDRRFIGTSAQTYAASSDHGRENRAAYGNVIPGGRGDPQYEGYPLGLDWYWDAATFDVTSVAKMLLFQIRIVNNSAEVYGAGIDYDSLYVGFQTRWLHAPPGLGRRANVHSLPAFGAVVANELGRTANCDNARFPSGTFGAGCAALTPRVGRGFLAGATGIMYLKSPIGDLRNKKFTQDPSNPFYNPAHPNAGDTLTFNRMSLCGFDCANVQFVPMDTRKAFGTIAAREADALDGRAPTSLTEYDYWHLFKPARGYNQPRVDLTAPRAGGGFNFCVPSGWSYTNRPPNAPAGSDTLFLDDCNPATNTITDLWADTLPDRSINWAFNNTWSGAGPFPLKAGDTTSLVVAIVAAPDSVQFMQLLRDAYDFYQDFYLGPGAPRPIRVVYGTTTGGVAGLNETSVRAHLDYSNVAIPDASIANTVRKLRTAPAGTALARLVELNPWLPDSVERMAGLKGADTIYVFKSCNGGRTFTATQTRGVCPADESRDPTGRAIGTGWLAYAALVRDSTGNFPSTFTDNFVVGGNRYLYSFVTHRPALAFRVIVDDTVGGIPTLAESTYTVLPALLGSLSTNSSAPNVLEVYVPMSTQAGGTPARLTVNVVGPTPLSYHIGSATLVAPLDSTLRYRVFFGDSIHVVNFDNLTRNAPDSTYLYLFRSAQIGFAGTSSAAVRIPRDTLTFRTDLLIGVSGAVAATTSARDSVNGADTIRVTTRVFRVPTAVVAEESTMRPYFASASLTSNFQTPTALAQPGAPPLIFNVVSRSGFSEAFWREPGFSRLRSVGTPTLTYRSHIATGARLGEYGVTWRDTEWGPGAPFTINVLEPSVTEAAVAASLEARVRADSTSVSQETVDIINRSLGTALTTDSLAPLYVPFVLRNYVPDSAGRIVTLAARRSAVPARIVLGTGSDTISVAVPSGQWVPGTPLILIENVDVADTLNGRPRVEGGRLVVRQEPRVTFRELVLGCVEPRASCNPVVGPGATGYVRIRAQQELRLRFFNPYTSESELAFTIEPAQIGRAVVAVTGRDLDRVRVIPNPYVVQSSYEQAVGQNERRLLFSNVPPQGVINIYTAAGALVQRLTWTPEILNGNGDLFWDMRTRENYEIGPGLYIFTVEATGEHRARRRTPGRFIIIR